MFSIMIMIMIINIHKYINTICYNHIQTSHNIFRNMNLIDDCYVMKGNYCIIEDHDMEVLEGLDALDALDSVEIIDIGAGVDKREGTVSDVLCEVELIEPLEDCEKDCDLEAHEVREINRNSNSNSNDNKKPLTTGIRVEFREVEVSINTSTVEEVIFKKHRVEIIDKRSRGCIMEGVVVGYTLVGRVYDPDIVLEFEDGRRFYNENFGYLMLFYI